jgi:cytochrome c-type biogenesis protein
MEVLREWSITWYAWLSQWGAKLSLPLIQLNEQIDIPILSAFILGMIASLSPCQVSTNSAAIAYISKDFQSRSLIVKQTLFFMIGKILMYSLIGISFIQLGLQMANVTESVPLLIWIRKLIGPFFILTGLYLLGLIQLKLSIGMEWRRIFLMQTRSTSFHHSNHRWKSSMGLGALLSCAFCPTLLWLFFGILIPMGTQTNEGILLPSVFAIGTLAPLLFFIAFIISSSKEISKQSEVKQRKIGKVVLRIAGIVFLLVGFNDTFIYWFIE